MTIISLKVRRIFDKNEPVDRLAPGPVKNHKERAKAVHEVLDDNPYWRAYHWGNTDSKEAHEITEAFLQFIGDPDTVQAVKNGLEYVGLIRKTNPSKQKEITMNVRTNMKSGAACYTVVSLLTAPPPREKIEGLTWEHPLAAITEGRFQGVSDPRAVAGILLVVFAWF